MRLSNSWLSKLVDSNNKAKAIPDKDIFHRTPELGVKVAARSGTVTFFIERRIKGGSNKRISLGKYPEVSLDEAKDKAHQAKRLLAEGKDPKEEQEGLREANRLLQAHSKLMELTLSELTDKYCDLRDDKTGAEYKKTLKLIFGEFLDTPVRDISAEDIARRFNEYKSRKASILKAMRYLKAIFNYGMKIEIDGEVLLFKNPVLIAETMLPREDTRPVPPKETVIPQDRLFDFVRALITECFPVARDCTLLQLLTGLRDSEAKQIRWTNVDFDKKVFTITDTKGKKDHTLPMSYLTYALLLSRKPDFNTDKRITNPEWVFPARGNKTHLGDIRKQLDKVRKKTGIEFTPHDLRRTFATLLEGELKLNTGVISRFLNHAPTNVTERHYMKAKASNLDGEANKLAWYINGLGDYTRDNGVGKWTDPYSDSIESVVYSFSDVDKKLQPKIDWSYILFQEPGNLEPDELYAILEKRE
jgi:integrase